MATANTEVTNFNKDERKTVNKALELYSKSIERQIKATDNDEMKEIQQRMLNGIRTIMNKINQWPFPGMEK